MRFGDILRLAIPLDSMQSWALEHCSNFLDPGEVETLRTLLKQRKLTVTEAHLGVSVIADELFPAIELASDEPGVERFHRELAAKSKKHIMTGAHEALSHDCLAWLSAGYGALGQEVREALSLQLFSRELHILLMGDSDRHKDAVLARSALLAPVSAHGRMGTDVISASWEGDQLMKGTLPAAHGGLACVSQLNRMRCEDASGLYSAMEKGYVRQDRLGRHHRLEARVSVLATCDPRYAQFVAKSAAHLRREAPFDQAIYARFNLIFFVDTQPAIGPAPTDEDLALVRGYIRRARAIEVAFPKELEEQAIMSSKDLHKERELLIDAGPRATGTVVKLAKARARSMLRQTVSADDLERAIAIVRACSFKSKTI